jgi:hypothetical protein
MGGMDGLFIEVGPSDRRGVCHGLLLGGVITNALRQLEGEREDAPARLWRTCPELGRVPRLCGLLF